MIMRAFHNDKKIKAKYVNRVIAHRKADNLIRGRGWTGTGGCAVGCTLEAYEHSRYEIELGIPEWLARVEDTLFEGMTEAKSRTWPEKFLKAIPLGVDLEQVKVPFIVKVLESALKSTKQCKYDKKANPQVTAAIKQTQAAIKRMIIAQKSQDSAKIEAARSAAESAAWSAAWSASARSAAELAARSAAWAARSAAESAAWSAAWAARSAAESAAWSAARAAWAARSAAESAAESAVYDKLANDLLVILKRCA